MGGSKKKVPMNFKGMPQADVPQGRNGKHKSIVTKILSDLDQVPKGVALKVPLADLAHSKEKVRAALNRATRKGGRKGATASDRKFIYMGNRTPERTMSSCRAGRAFARVLPGPTPSPRRHTDTPRNKPLA